MTSHFSITGLSGATVENSPTVLGWQLAQRIQLTVKQVAKQKPDASVDELARELDIRLRRFGVVMTPKELREHANSISATPG
ncbi:hypothetical protein [Cryptosporangium arvum]|uniref:hypothetical protein n=1 Tax=Cryptosporangium arvum TaxID=80871 RepID=UPI00055D50B0|nr:hypothetical protein [Cryptosporangium arvum]